MPQVALLFLLLSPQPRLDVLWQPWLEAAAGLLPASAVKPCGDGSAAAGGAEEVEGAALLCGLLAGNETVPAVHRQLLFNVYATWHSTFVLGRQEEQPLFGQERSGPGLLAGVHVVDPPSARAKFSSPATLLSRTVRALLAEALAAPRNTRFLLLSDAHAPLYPATATYLVALHGEDATVLEPDDCPVRANS